MKNGHKKEITGNLFGFYRKVAEVCGYRSGTFMGLNYVWNEQGSWPRYLLGTPGMEDLTAIAGAMEKGEIPPFWIMERTVHLDLRHLEHTGIRAIREWKGMVLERWREDFIREFPDMELRVNDPDTGPHWLELVNRELMSGSQIDAGFIRAIEGSAPFSWIVAYLNDVPVSTGLAYTEGGVTGLYMIVTKKGFRGRGIGSLVTGELIKNALGSGVEHIVLHATREGERIYRRIGFREENRFSVLWHLGT